MFYHHSSFRNAFEQYHETQAGCPFRSSKVGTTIVPRTRAEADLVVHLEVDNGVRSYRPVLPTTIVDAHLGSAIGEVACYEVVHRACSFILLLLDRDCASSTCPVTDKIAHGLVRSALRVFLVDHRLLRREPRWTNVRQIFACRDYPVSPGDRLRVLDFVDMHGQAELEDCAALCRASDEPVASVLALVASASLALDLERSISHGSLLEVHGGPDRVRHTDGNQLAEIAWYTDLHQQTCTDAQFGAANRNARGGI